MSDNIQGGSGNDILIGNSGADIFVLESAAGTDIIRDFRNGVNYFGLNASLGFSDLSITDSLEGTDTLIVNTTNNKLLAILNNLSAANLTEKDFTNI